MSAALLVGFPSPAGAHSDPPAVLSAYGTPTVDGVISSGEYPSCVGPFQVGGGVPLIYTLTICETNDEQNDYYAVAIDDLTDDTDDTAVFWFEEAHSGVIADAAPGCPYGDPNNEDRISWVAAFGGFSDGWYCRQPNSLSVGTDTPNGTAARQFTPGVGSVYEFAHPLDSGDADDYGIVPHDTIGWCFTYDDQSNPNQKIGSGGGDLQRPAGCYKSPVDETNGLIRGTSIHFGDVFKLSYLDALLVQMKNKLKQYVAGCSPIPCPPRAKRLLLEKVNEAIQALRIENRAGAVEALQAFVRRARRLIDADGLSETKGQRFVKRASFFAEEIRAYEPPSPSQPLPPPGPGQRPVVERIPNS